MWGQGRGDLAVCSEVCWFICGQLVVVLAGYRSVVFVLANMAGWVRQCGGCGSVVGGMTFSHWVLVVCCILGCAAGLLCVWLFFAVWPGIDGSGLSNFVFLLCTYSGDEIKLNLNLNLHILGLHISGALSVTKIGSFEYHFK